MKKLIAFIFIALLLYSSCIPVLSQPLSNNEYAIEKMEKEIKKHKNDMSLYLSLCMLYYNDKQYDKMLNIMHKINRHFKPNTIILTAFNKYSIDLYDSKQYKLALDVSKLTSDNYKDDPDAALIYSRALVKTGNINHAISFLNAFLKRNPLEMLLYDKLIDLYIYKKDYSNAFKSARTIQDKKMSNIYFYFLEALILLNEDQDKSMEYLKAYLDKLSMENDYEPRIKAAKKLYDVLSNSSNGVEDYIELIKYSEKLKAPDSYILIELRYAVKKFPEEAYFTDKIDVLNSKIGL